MESGAEMESAASAAPSGSDTAGILRAAADGRIELLVLLGADPLADVPDADLARRALAGARRVVSLDTFLTPSSAQADVVLPAAAYAEQDGTTTNLEGRVTGLARKVTPAGTSRPDWMIAAELADRLGLEDLAVELGSCAAITAAIAAGVPAYAGVTADALATGTDGVLAVPAAASGLDGLGAGDTAVAERISYDYRVVVRRKLYDGAVGTMMSPSLAPLAVRAVAAVHPLDLSRLGVDEGTDVRVIGPRGSLVLPLVGDAAVPKGAVFVPFNPQGAASAADIVDLAAPVHDVRIERL
jgi:predicted molibdopterin-dependent oxidoreductase YjgC